MKLRTWHDVAGRRTTLQRQFQEGLGRYVAQIPNWFFRFRDQRTQQQIGRITVAYGATISSSKQSRENHCDTDGSVTPQSAFNARCSTSARSLTRRAEGFKGKCHILMVTNRRDNVFIHSLLSVDLNITVITLGPVQTSCVLPPYETSGLVVCFLALHSKQGNAFCFQGSIS